MASRWVIDPPNEFTEAPDESEIVLNCVLYQNLLLRPCGRRNALEMGPRRMLPRAFTVKSEREHARPANSFEASLGADAQNGLHQTGAEDVPGGLTCNHANTHLSPLLFRTQRWIPRVEDRMESRNN